MMGKRINRVLLIFAAGIVLVCTGACAASAEKDVPGRPYDIRTDVQERIRVGTISAQPYIKGGARPCPEVRDGKKALILGKDYAVRYQNNEKISQGGEKAAVSIIGLGDYAGTRTVPFEVTQSSLAGSSIMVMVGDVAFQNEGSICNPILWVIDHGYPLAAGADYETIVKYSYKNNTVVGTSRTDASKTAGRAAGETVHEEDIVPAGTVLVASVTGKGAYAGSSREAEFHVAPGTDISRAETVIKPQAYTGHAITLPLEDVSVVVDGRELTKDGADYEIAGYVDRINPGTAKVMIKGCGAYAGAIEAEFEILADG